MAHILFISINDINASGIRMLSACLKKEGHDASVIFFKRPGFPYTTEPDKYFEEAKKIEEGDWVGIHYDGAPFRYSRGPAVTAEEERLLVDTIRNINPDMIGFSATAPLFERIGQISKRVKKEVDLPVVWGGAGPTIDPETCIAYCDYVSIGESEETLLAIADKLDKKEDFSHVNNLCYMKDGNLVRNPLNPLVTDLDALPFQDISPEGKYLIEDNRLTENFSEFSYAKRYHMMGSRGCPFQCSYCTESFYKILYAPQKFLRRRSPESVIEEIKKARETVPFDVVQFEDEVFSLDYDWLVQFKDQYVREINLPFSCYIYPVKNLDKQLDLLKEAGMFDTCLSLQSGSKYINGKIFKRVFKKEQYLETAKKLDELGIRFYTDVITYNPFETEEDLKETLDVLLQIPKPLVVFINKLYFLKNTAIEKIYTEALPSSVHQTPERIFDYYSRLFWFSFEHGEKFVKLCRKLFFLRFFPGLLRSEKFVAILRKMVNT